MRVSGQVCDSCRLDDKEWQKHLGCASAQKVKKQGSSNAKYNELLFLLIGSCLWLLCGTLISLTPGVFKTIGVTGVEAVFSFCLTGIGVFIGLLLRACWKDRKAELEKRKRCVGL